MCGFAGGNVPFAVWLEPTRVIWGWLRGEAFYEGRPTSWWRSEIGQWKQIVSFGSGPHTASREYERKPSLVESYLSRFANRRSSVGRHCSMATQAAKRCCEH